MLQLFTKVKASKNCTRCGLRYPQKDEECPHCTGMTDLEVTRLKAEHESFDAGEGNLGRYFLIVAMLSLAGLIAMYVVGT